MSDDTIGRLRSVCGRDGVLVTVDVADLRALLAALDASQREAERLRGERDQARRAALEEAIATLEAVECIGLEEGATYGAALLRALLDAPAPAREA